jgi:hypothetical protein
MMHKLSAANLLMDKERYPLGFNTLNHNMLTIVEINASLNGKEPLDIIAKRWTTVIFPFKQLIISL